MKKILILFMCVISSVVISIIVYNKCNHNNDIEDTQVREEYIMPEITVIEDDDSNSDVVDEQDRTLIFDDYSKIKIDVSDYVEPDEIVPLPGLYKHESEYSNGLLGFQSRNVYCEQNIYSDDLACRSFDNSFTAIVSEASSELTAKEHMINQMAEEFPLYVEYGPLGLTYGETDSNGIIDKDIYKDLGLVSDPSIALWGGVLLEDGFKELPIGDCYYYMISSSQGTNQILTKGFIQCKDNRIIKFESNSYEYDLTWSYLTETFTDTIILIK